MAINPHPVGFPLGPHPPFFNPWVFGSEILFTIFSVLLCFFIFYKTREIYELTKHNGIKYFRYAFLFFGLSYLMRLLLGIVQFSSFAMDSFIRRDFFVPMFMLPVGYFSTIGIITLLLGLIWKRVNEKVFLFIGNVIAISLPIISFLLHEQMILAILQSTLLVIAIILNIFMHNEKKRFSQIQLLYFLVAALWLINLFIIDRRRPFPFELNILFQAISIAVFIFIYYRVAKWTK